VGENLSTEDSKENDLIQWESDTEGQKSTRKRRSRGNKIEEEGPTVLIKRENRHHNSIGEKPKAKGGKERKAKKFSTREVHSLWDLL